MNEPKIDIEIHEGLAGLDERWRRLEQEGACTPFQTWAWTTALLDSFARSAHTKCYVLIATDRHAGRDHVIFPVVHTKRSLNSGLKMPDFGMSDYNAPLMSRDVLTGAVSFKRIWLKLLKEMPPASFLHLQKVPEHIAGHKNPLLDIPGFRKETYGSWFMTLSDEPPTPDSVFNGRPFKKRMRSFRRRLEEAGTVADCVPDTAEKQIELLAWILQKQEQRFERLGRKPSTPMAEMLAFQSALIRSSSPSFRVDVRGLSMDGTVIAALYGLRQARSYYQIICAMDETWARLAPGLVLMWRTVEAMHRDGCSIYDFTIGDEDYKQDFRTEVMPIYEMMKPLSITSLPTVSWYAAHPRLVAAKRNLVAQQDQIRKSISKLLNR